MNIMPPTSEPHYSDSTTTLHHGDCLDVLRSMPDASVDSVVTDPPYGLEFMGKDWDGADGFRRSLNPNDAGRDNAFGRTSKTSPEYNTGRGARVLTERAAELTERGKGHSTSAGPYLASGVDSVRVAGRPFQEWCEAWSRECLRVLKPGGHLLAFGGTRTFHRLACAVEDSGFEIRDSLAWLYGSGFPKSLDVSKAIDKAAGAERGIVGPDPNWRARVHSDSTYDGGQTRPEFITAPATPDAERWQGWGTALKPAFEPVVVARKPLAGTVAQTVLAHGTGALNVDGCRVGDGSDSQGERPPHESSATSRYAERGAVNLAATPGPRGGSPSGRWPANVILDESQAAALDAMSGERIGSRTASPGNESGEPSQSGVPFVGGKITSAYDDQGGASRFFYVAKADASERVRVDGIAHPTVKPLALMRWLVRLVTPPGGTVLEPFAGSGTTVEACVLEGFDCIAIEREAEYLPLIRQRINRRRDPVEAVKAAGEDAGLFGLLDGEAS